MAETEYSRIIMRHARARLAPLGLFKRGARTWILDKAYWLVIVDFQPHKWEPGGYLNVASHWLWSHEGYISFDYSRSSFGRVGEFARFEDGESFESVAANLVSNAASEANYLCGELSSIEGVANKLSSRSPKSGWAAFDAAIAVALSGDYGRAKDLFARVPVGLNEEIAWQCELIRRSSDLVELLHDPEEFKLEIVNRVLAARVKLKLPKASISFD